MTLRRLLCALLAGTFGAPIAHTAEDPAGSAALRCQTLATTDFSVIQDAPTQVRHARLIEADSQLPAHCRAEGYITPQVGVGLLLPIANWNGKLLVAGCGGNCGSLFWPSCDDPLRRGYACVVSDMGHTSTVVDSLWAHNNLQAELDFGFRATHVSRLAGWAVVERFYGKLPRKSYFMGCSQGGRQGLVAAQRFPWDFDGIIAGAPPISITTGHWLHLLWRKRSFLDAGGRLSLTAEELQSLHQSVLAACDRDDGVRDGLISYPPACRFDPEKALRCTHGKTTACLTADQVATVKKIYTDAVNQHGYLISRGELPGTELHWGQWRDNRVAEKFRYMVFWPDPGSQWQESDFEFEHDFKRAGMMEALYDNANPDLRKFEAAGGKLLLYHGWADEGVSPLTTVDYYETVERTMGSRKATQEFVRLFMVPGMNHCTGGTGAFAIDYLSALEAWVEEGKAPAALIGAHVEGPSKTPRFTRPIYPYPYYARYRGTGDPNKAENFRAVAAPSLK